MTSIQPRLLGLFQLCRGIVVALAMTMPLMAFAASPQPADTISVRRAFVEYPVAALDILSRTNRLDMLDYWDVDSIWSATNGMEGLSHLDAVTHDYLKVTITPVSSLQLKILPLRKGGQLLMSIYTVGDSTQAPDSDVKFFNAQMQELDRTKFLPYPKLKEFFEIPKGCETSQKEIDKMIPFPTVEYDAAASSTTLKAKLTIGDYMNVDDYNIIKLFLKPEVEYEWKDGKFKSL